MKPGDIIAWNTFNASYPRRCSTVVGLCISIETRVIHGNDHLLVRAILSEGGVTRLVSAKDDYFQVVLSS